MRIPGKLDLVERARNALRLPADTLTRDSSLLQPQKPRRNDSPDLSSSSTIPLSSQMGDLAPKEDLGVQRRKRKMKDFETAVTSTLSITWAQSPMAGHPPGPSGRTPPTWTVSPPDLASQSLQKFTQISLQIFPKIESINGPTINVRAVPRTSSKHQHTRES